MDLKNKKILVTGGAGFLGGFVTEKLISRGVPERHIAISRSRECDLRNKKDCEEAVRGQDVVIHLAAKVGGIGFNRDHPAELFYDNAIMGIQLMEAARQEGVEKFVAIGTVCSYPKFTPVPFQEDNLWNGYPEETNAPYGIAKMALLAQAQAYREQYGFNSIYLLPVNMYGPRDKFDLEKGHVIPALIRKVYEAKHAHRKYIEVWGTGKATREFLYVEDAAEGVILAAERYDKPEPVNMGSGMEISIAELAQTIASLMDFEGEIRWDSSKPDGQPRRMLDISRAEKEFGFRAKTTLEEGMQKVIEWYKNSLSFT